MEFVSVPLKYVQACPHGILKALEISGMEEKHFDELGGDFPLSASESEA